MLCWPELCDSTWSRWLPKSWWGWCWLLLIMTFMLMLKFMLICFDVHFGDGVGINAGSIDCIIWGKVAWHEERWYGEVETPSERCKMWEVAWRGRLIWYGMLILKHATPWSIVPLAIGCCSKWKQSLFCEPAFEILLSLCMRSPNTFFGNLCFYRRMLGNRRRIFAFFNGL